MARLEAHRPITWHLLPGNHDEATTGGIWERIGALGVPANVKVLAAAEMGELAPGVALLPAPLLARHVTADPTAWMDAAATPDHPIRIGLAHGATLAFGSDPSGDGVISANRADTAGLAYLALGDWHGARQAGARAWYAGTPEPDQYPDNEPGFVLAVEVTGPRDVRVERIATAEFMWWRRRLEAGDTGAMERLRGEIAAAGPKADRVLLALTVNGTVSLAEDTRLRRELARLGAGLCVLEPDLAGLRLASEDFGATLADDVALSGVAKALAAVMASAASEAERETAAEALRRVAELGDSVPLGALVGERNTVAPQPASERGEVAGGAAAAASGQTLRGKAAA